jgi:3-oxoacyl-[acyl-carrier protein] reductase
MNHSAWRGFADRIGCAAIAHGYAGTPLAKDLNQLALDKSLDQVSIRRLIEP